MNKQGGLTDIFLFMIIAIIIVFMSGIFIYLGEKVNSELQEKMGDKTFGDKNGTELVNETIGKVNTSYQALYWISVFLIVGMVISIFIGSYLVTTKPIFFIPYIFITVIAVIISAGISNAYEEVIKDPTLTSTFNNFVGANFIMLKLPIWITVIGVVGGIIMFVRMGSKEEEIYGGYYG